MRPWQIIRVETSRTMAVTFRSAKKLWRCGVLLLDEHPLRLAEHVQRDVLGLDTEVLTDHLAAVRIPMSSSIVLRRSPKPGAFTAATFRPPRSLFTANVASA